MEFKSWDESKIISLLPCPFCGSKPKIRYIGNEHTKKRSVRVKCSNTKCRVERTDSGLTQCFGWLEDVAAKHWNNRLPDQENPTDACLDQKGCATFNSGYCNTDSCKDYQRR